MKTIFLLFLTFTGLSVFSQVDSFTVFLKKGKAEFQKEFDQQDYTAAIQNLEKAVRLKTNHAEAHYFLAYAYSRLNSKDGKGMVQMSLPLTLKCSEELETVNKLSPKYAGENIILDPYSKLTAEWGAMAMTYWHNNKIDSSIWSFNEGKRRGGFGDFFLSTNRAVLDKCSKDAILVTFGDNFTIPLWYLQIMEGYRKDVSVIDISLLNTKWYPGFLAKKGLVQFDLPKAVIDTIDYCKWQDSTITIGDFTWTVKPSYYNEYLLRGDRLFLSMLKENRFKRDIYFTTGFGEDMRLSLTEHLHPLILIDKLITNKQAAADFESYKVDISKILLLVKTANTNSQQELAFIDNIRYNLLMQITQYLKSEDKNHAKELLKLMDTYTNEKKYPYQNESIWKYSKQIRSRF